MKTGCRLMLGAVTLASGMHAIADEIKAFAIGDAEVVYDYETTETNVAILTLVGFVTETNDSLRGLKNADARRLGKLGQLIYQCKLMIDRSKEGSRDVAAKDPVLIAKNYSLFTGVDLPLASDERVGIQVQALPVVDDASLFSDSLGPKAVRTGIWETVGDGSAIDLKQFNVDALRENEWVDASESLEINIRFPVFQLEKPVSRWNYNFALRDFKQAIRLIDQDCTPARLVDLMMQHG